MDAAFAKAGAPPSVKLNVTKYTLQNGLEVILSKNPAAAALRGYGNALLLGVLARQR